MNTSGQSVVQMDGWMRDEIQGVQQSGPQVTIPVQVPSAPSGLYVSVTGPKAVALPPGAGVSHNANANANANAAARAPFAERCDAMRRAENGGVLPRACTGITSHRIAIYSR